MMTLVIGVLSAPTVVGSSYSAHGRTLPQLDPGTLPPPYFILGETRREGLSSMRDPDIERIEHVSASYAVPAPPVPPPELTKSGKPLTRKEKKAVRPSDLHLLRNGVEHVLPESSKIKLPDPAGLISLLPTKQTFLAYIVKWRRYVFAISLTQNVFTERMTAT